MTANAALKDGDPLEIDDPVSQGMLMGADTLRKKLLAVCGTDLTKVQRMNEFWYAGANDSSLGDYRLKRPWDSMSKVAILVGAELTIVGPTCSPFPVGAVGPLGLLSESGALPPGRDKVAHLSLAFNTQVGVDLEGRCWHVGRQGASSQGWLGSFWLQVGRASHQGAQGSVRGRLRRPFH